MKPLSNLKTTFARFSNYKVLDGKLDFDIEKLKTKSKIISNAINTLSTFVKNGGGKKAVEQHTIVRKKLLARKRIELLLDENSPFLELGMFAGIAMDYGNIPAAGIVAGIGKIHGRYCLVGANDATVKGGVFFPATVKKQTRLQTIAQINCVPSIYLVDTGGAFLPLQSEIFPDAEHGGRVFYNEAVFSSQGIPQLSIVCGSSTAGGAYCPIMAEECIIVNKIGIVYLGGPPLVKAAIGEIVSEQDLGGAELHCRTSGCTDYFANEEKDAFEMCRESVYSLNLPVCHNDVYFKDPLYLQEELDLFDVKDYIEKADVYKILARIVDASAFKEFKKEFGNSLICGFSEIHGKLVGIVANCGFITCQDAEKGSHFIQLCDKRKIPLIFLQNSNRNQEVETISNASLIKERAKMIKAHCSANVPKIIINIGGCFADDNYMMCGVPFDCNFSFSWPSAQVLTERPKTLVGQDFFDNLPFDDKDAYFKLFENRSTAFFRASQVFIDNIIMPSQTRKTIALCLDIALTKTSHMVPEEENYSPLFRM